MTDFVRKLKEEPTVIVMTFQVFLALLVAFGFVGFTDAQTGAVLAVVAGISGVLLGLDVRPFSWPLVTGAVQAAIVLLAEFGTELSEEQVGAVYGFVAALGIIIRQFVTPEVKLSAPPNG